VKTAGSNHRFKRRVLRIAGGDAGWRTVGSGMFLRKLLQLFFSFILAVVVSGCSVSGRVLHVDNRTTIPYTIEDVKLKRKLLRVLIRRHLLTEAQLNSCSINIMEIDRYYLLEVWPAGNDRGAAFGIKLKKPFLVPVEKYNDLR
jgi:hypothetical protein